MAIEKVETPVELTAEAKSAGMRRPKKLVKGSAATKRWMAHLRNMRKSAKKASSPKRRKASRKGRKMSRKGSKKASKKAAKTPMRRRRSRKGVKKSAKGSRKARK